MPPLMEGVSRTNHYMKCYKKVIGSSVVAFFFFVDSIKVKGIDITISVIAVRHFNDMVIICSFFFNLY